MQKFHDLLEDFLINRRVVCCLCLGKQTSYIVHRALKQLEGLSSRVCREFFVFPPLTQVFWSQAFSVCGFIVFVSSYDWLVALVVFLWSSPMLLRTTVIRKSF